MAFKASMHSWTHDANLGVSLFDQMAESERFSQDCSFAQHRKSGIASNIATRPERMQWKEGFSLIAQARGNYALISTRCATKVRGMTQVQPG